jgi:hypothetical protein
VNFGEQLRKAFKTSFWATMRIEILIGSFSGIGLVINTGG